MKIRITFEWDVEVPDDGDMQDSVKKILSRAGGVQFGVLLKRMAYHVDEVPPWEQSSRSDFKV